MIMLLGLIVCPIVALLLYFSWMHTAPLHKKGTDAMIILGYKCDDDRIHPLLLDRLAASLELLEMYDYKKIILTGGPVTSAQSEAVIMKDYLVQHGVNQDKIVLEQHARDTVQNISNCQTIMQRFNLKTSTVISNSFHIRRTQWIAKFLGFPSYYYANRSIRAVFKQGYCTLYELKAYYATIKVIKNRSVIK